MAIFLKFSKKKAQKWKVGFIIHIAFIVIGVNSIDGTRAFFEFLTHCTCFVLGKAVAEIEEKGTPTFFFSYWVP